MNALGWRVAVLALLLGAYFGARGAWLWQDNHYGKALADQAGEYRLEREDAAAAVIKWQAEEQEHRRGLEDRLESTAGTHWKEMSDAKKTQDRLRDRLATADLRLSVVLAATSVEGCGCGVPTATSTAGVVHGVVRADLDPAHAQRIIAITDEGDRGLIALKACQAYVREVTR
ncbi:lysis system i-spanin subunit Rz [Pseudomonas reidholzensis]|uniref:lysis system i-spanin subunit Rz n=1 Tax=Pseudomonas reidholzensis TaxID=1785162 RepID=UPI000E5AFE3E|nr:lysis system i-spanin subunit Rz [Pseudomonas reidholzensis]